jgi:hypothetical protein
MHHSIGALEKEIDRISELTATLGEIPGNVLSRDNVNSIIRLLSYKREDYEDEIKRRKQNGI